MREDDSLKLRFALGPEAAQALTKGRVVKRYRQGASKKEWLIRTHFDTPRKALHRAGVELSVTEVGGRRSQQVRAPTEPGRRGCWTCELDGLSPGLARVDDATFPRRLRDRRRDARLEAVFTSCLESARVRLRKGGTLVDLRTLRGHLRAQARVEAVCEAELSLVSGDPVVLMDVALELIEDHDLRLRAHSLHERGFALAAAYLRPKPRKATRVALSSDMTVRDAFLAASECVLDHLLANEIPTLDGHPEGIHQSRVAIRCLRAVLRAFKKALPYDGRKAFNYEFRWFQKKMGPARDWHVFLDETMPRIAGGIDERRLQKVRRIARAERLRTSRAAAAYLRSRRFTRLMLQFLRWLEVLRSEEPGGVLDKRLGPFSRRVLERTHRRLLTDQRALVHLTADELHALRIRAKKVRYPSEFFGALYPPAATRPQLRLLGKFQDLLGEANDARTAGDLLSRLRPHRLSLETTRAVGDWAAQRVRKCCLAAQPAWRRLRKIEPFWRPEAAEPPQNAPSAEQGLARAS
jgi:CHAD domain-containing protein